MVDCSECKLTVVENREYCMYCLLHSIANSLEDIAESLSKKGVPE
jgi:hypothetical protein